MSVSGTDYKQELFPGTSPQPIQSDKNELLVRSVTSCRLTNINVIPIDYAFRPRLRVRLTLLRLTLSRNPWSFGGGVSHTPYVTHVSIRTSDASSRLYNRPSRAYGTLPYHALRRPQLRYVA